MLFIFYLLHIQTIFSYIELIFLGPILQEVEMMCSSHSHPLLSLLLFTLLLYLSPRFTSNLVCDG